MELQGVLLQSVLDLFPPEDKKTAKNWVPLTFRTPHQLFLICRSYLNVIIKESV